jgi:hypothetical protein
MSVWLFLALVVVVLCGLAALAWWWSGRTPAETGRGSPRRGGGPTLDNPDPDGRTLGSGSTGS